MKPVIILQRVEYEEIVSRLDQISNLQKQLFFALEMRNPRHIPSTTKPENEK